MTAGLALNGALQQVAHQAEGRRAAGDQQGPSAAAGLLREIDGGCADGRKDGLEELGLFDVFVFLPRPDDLAPVVRDHLQAVQGLGGCRLEPLETEILREDLKQVTYAGGPGELEAVLLERVVDVLLQVRIILQVLPREEHVLVAGRTRRDDVHAHPVGHGQVPGTQRIGEQFIDVEVGRRSAAVPILQFLERDADALGRLEGRGHVPGGHLLQRAPGEQCIGRHEAPPLGMTRSMTLLKASSRLMRGGRIGRRPFSIKPVAVTASCRNSRGAKPNR